MCPKSRLFRGVGLGLNGSSAGQFLSQISYGTNPDLLEGTPLATRSNEWNVQMAWAIAAIYQGFPVTDQKIPVGQSKTLPQTLPRMHWSVAFRASGNGCVPRSGVIPGVLIVGLTT